MAIEIKKFFVKNKKIILTSAAVLVLGVIIVAIIVILMSKNKPAAPVNPNPNPAPAPAEPVPAEPIPMPEAAQFVVYSGVNQTGVRVVLPGPGAYAIDTGCAAVATEGIVLGFTPLSFSIPSGYEYALKGYYGNPGDGQCGPSQGLGTVPMTACANDIYSDNCANNNWVKGNVNGLVVIY